MPNRSFVVRNILALLATGSLLVACSDRRPTAPPTVAKVTVTLPGTLEVGQTVTAVANALDQTGAILTGRAVTWSVGDQAVAAVTSAGLLTAIAPGTTTVTATVDGRAGSASVTVTPVPVATVAVSLSATSIVAGTTTTATAVARDAAGNSLTGRSVVWSASDPAIATITPAGVISALAPGSTNVTATVEGRSGSAALTVTPVPVASVVVTLGAASLTVGASTNATATARDSASNVLTGRPIVWVSSHPSVASISPTGVLTALAPGSTTVTATVEGRAGSATFTVTPVPVATVSVTLGAASVMVGDTSTATATARSAAGIVLTGRSVMWTSSDPNVASISSTGLISALAPGTTIVSATIEGSAGNASLVVSPEGSANTVRAVLALAADQTAVGTETAAIVNEIGQVSFWFRSQAEGRAPMWFAEGGTPVVRIVRLPRLRASYEAAGSGALAMLQSDLASVAPAALNQWSFVWIDIGFPGACGLTSGRASFIFEAQCRIYPSATSFWPAGGTYLLAHELTHLLGAVPACAPNYSGGGHVGDDPRDVLYVGSLARDWNNLILDPGRNDYYKTGRTNCPGIENHPLWSGPVPIAPVTTAPTIRLPANNAVLNGSSPWLTDFAWSAVTGAVGYYVEIDLCLRSTTPDYSNTCESWFLDRTFSSGTISATSFYSGAFPGRWRVRGIAVDRSLGPWSTYGFFRYGP